MDIDAKWLDDVVPDGAIKTPHQGICPDGWHIPSKEEWETFYNEIRSLYDLNEYAAVQSTRHLLWSNATNESGFSVLPVGFNIGYDYENHNLYQQVAEKALFWGASEVRYDHAICWELYASGTVVYGEGYKHNGFSVRCVQDTPVKP